MNEGSRIVMSSRRTSFWIPSSMSKWLISGMHVMQSTSLRSPSATSLVMELGSLKSNAPEITNGLGKGEYNA